MSASSSINQPNEEEIQLLNEQFKKSLRTPLDHDNIGTYCAIDDETMFFEESRACNFLAPIIRDSKHGGVYCDSLYVLEFLRRRRNEKNSAIISSLKIKNQLHSNEFKRLVAANFKILDDGHIENFWKIYRNPDINLTNLTDKRFSIRYKSAKAFLFPCYMGQVYSGDTSKSHVVLFAIYSDPLIRQIIMYDSLIKSTQPELIKRFDFEGNVLNEKDLIFSTQEKTDKIFIQKTFHLLESYIHALELFDNKIVMYESDYFVKTSSGLAKQQFFKPQKYKFFRTGYSNHTIQKYHDCSYFTVFGMYNILRHWRQPAYPHVMKFKEYDQILERPVITVNQFICCSIIDYLIKQEKIINILLKDAKLSIHIINNSNTEEDCILQTNLHENLTKSTDYIFRNFEKSKLTLEVISNDVLDLNLIVMKFATILIFDRSFTNIETIESMNQMIDKILESTLILIVIYPTQAIVIHQRREMKSVSEVTKKNFKVSSDEISQLIENQKLLTYCLPVFCNELERPNDIYKSLLYSPKVDWKTFYTTILELPPNGTELLVKPPGCNFLPFKLNF